MDEFVDELFVGEAGGLPELGVHADAGETGHGIDFVEVDARGFALPFFGLGGWLHEEVDAGQAGAVAGAEGGDRHFADLVRLGFGDVSGDDGDAGGGVVFGVVVVELSAGNDFAYDGGFGG